MCSFLLFLSFAATTNTTAISQLDISNGANIPMWVENHGGVGRKGFRDHTKVTLRAYSTVCLSSLLLLILAADRYLWSKQQFNYLLLRQTPCLLAGSHYTYRDNLPGDSNGPSLCPVKPLQNCQAFHGWISLCILDSWLECVFYEHKEQFHPFRGGAFFDGYNIFAEYETCLVLRKIIQRSLSLLWLCVQNRSQSVILLGQCVEELIWHRAVRNVFYSRLQWSALSVQPSFSVTRLPSHSQFGLHWNRNVASPRKAKLPLWDSRCSQWANEYLGAWAKSNLTLLEIECSFVSTQIICSLYVKLQDFFCALGWSKDCETNNGWRW